MKIMCYNVITITKEVYKMSNTEPKIYILWSDENDIVHRSPMCYSASVNDYNDTYTVYAIEYNKDGKKVFEDLVVPRIHAFFCI